MSLINGMRLVSALSGGSMTSAALTTAIATPAGLAGWKAAVASPAQRAVLIGDKTARTAWLAANTAMAAMFERRDAVRDIFAHTDALKDVASANSPMDEFWKSREARIELWTNEKALKEFDRYGVAVARGLLAGSKQVSTPYLGGSNTTILSKGRYILLAVGGNGGSVVLTLNAGAKALTGVAWQSVNAPYMGTTPAFMALDGPFLVSGQGTVSFHYIGAD